MTLPLYPNFISVSLDLQAEVQNIILKSASPLSALSFANLHLFREKYGFKVAKLNDSLIVKGSSNGENFFSVIGKIPPNKFLTELLKNAYWKNVMDTVENYTQTEDRDNFEYLYLHTDLANLEGKNFQKKRNLVNAFLKEFSPEEREQKILNDETKKSALQVLEKWRQNRGSEGDYKSAKEAIELHEKLNFFGMVFFVRGVPVGYCQGEPLADSKSFAIHFEHAIDEYKGVYQYINQQFARSIPPEFEFINREQDLGDEGLRQAKMTYRPIGFVKTHIVR
ncbi:ABC transporter permease [Fibrobacterales bacterium]|nr:ABC transporter permease [Fibrobacterales bacterium]